MPSETPHSNPMPEPELITCSFCGHQDGGEEDKTIIIVGTMGANICEKCVVMCAKALTQAKMTPQEELPAEG